MISIKDFTKDEGNNKPIVSGHYLVSMTKYNKVFLQVCWFNRNSSPPNFEILVGDGSLTDATVIGWCLIDDPIHIANQLAKQ